MGASFECKEIEGGNNFQCIDKMEKKIAKTALVEETFFICNSALLEILFWHQPKKRGNRFHNPQGIYGRIIVPVP